MDTGQKNNQGITPDIKMIKKPKWYQERLRYLLRRENLTNCFDLLPSRLIFESTNIFQNSPKVFSFV